MIRLRDFLCQTERQAVMKACRTLGIELEKKHEKLINCNGSQTDVLPVMYITREQLAQIVEGYKARYKERGHYSSMTASKRHAKILKQYDKYIEGLKCKED